jgi:hypothetical protein
MVAWTSQVPQMALTIPMRPSRCSADCGMAGGSRPPPGALELAADRGLWLFRVFFSSQSGNQG